MAKQIRIVHNPEVPSPEGHYPSINIPDPFNPSQRVIPQPIFGDDNLVEEKDRVFFDLDPVCARRVLESDSHIYLLWEPETLNVNLPGPHGTTKSETLSSVKPLALKGVKDLRKGEVVVAAKTEPKVEPKEKTPKVEPKEKTPKVADPDASNPLDAALGDK